MYNHLVDMTLGHLSLRYFDFLDTYFFLIDQERIEKVGHFYRKLRYSQMHSNPGATLKIPKNSKYNLKIFLLSAKH